MKFRSVKGTKDTLPDEIHKWHYIESTIHSVMRSFNYREIRTPVFEETALFARGIGELTDIVGKEMYTFQDRGGTMLTLKPEMTAAVMRSYVQHNLGELQPMVKVYYISPMFRQERPQAGRMREFHQFGAEAIGSPNPVSDAEIIALSVEIYKNLGLKNFEVKVNSVGCEICRPPYKILLQDFLTTVLDRLSDDSRNRFEQNPLRILDSKNETDMELTRGAPLIKDHLCETCSVHFSNLQGILSEIGIPFAIDGRIVRGLDYYTKTAYEIVSSDLGSQDALAGGGRYDLLIREIGGKQTPSVGFAAGMERLIMAMEKQNAGFGGEQAPQVFIACADDAGRSWAVETSMKLRREGISCEIDFLDRSLKSQMREADRQASKFVIIAGGDEIKESLVLVKVMSTGEQLKILTAGLVGYFKNIK